MMKFTPEDLVKYLYNETSEQKTASIKAALQTDWYLRETYEKLASSVQNLKEVNFSPRPETINKIFEYASKRRIQITSI